MPKIQCLSGPAVTPVGNENYVFARDPHGRFVCDVRNLRHSAILLGLDIYVEATDLGPVIVDPTDPEAFAALEERCNQLVIDLGKVEADLVTANNLLVAERELTTTLKKQLAAGPATEAKTGPLEPGLLGSDNQPSYIEVGETSYPLGDIVAKSQDESGLTAEAWNALTQPERESRIAATIEIMRAPPKADNLQDISGIGPAAEQKLHGAGIVSFKQIAEMPPADLLALDKKLGLGGISERSGWLDQAKALMDQAASSSDGA